MCHERFTRSQGLKEISIYILRKKSLVTNVMSVEPKTEPKYENVAFKNFILQ